MALTDLIRDYWKMDEPNGGDIRADQTYAMPLDDESALTGSAAGKIGLAASFNRDNLDALTQWASPGITELGAFDWCGCFWYYSVLGGGAAPGRGLLCLANTSDLPNSAFAITLVGTTTVRFTTYSGALATPTVITATTVSGLNNWHFVCFGWDNTAGKMWLQVDDATRIDSALGIGQPNPGTDLKYEFGRWNGGDGGDDTKYFSGLIDLAALWLGRTLSTAETTQLYNGGAGIDLYPTPPAASTYREAFPLTATFTHAADVVPDDAVDFTAPEYADGFWVGVTGDISLVTRGGETIVLVGVPAGTYLPIQCARVNATGTTATSLVRFWRE